MSHPNILKIYCDGGARGNPGPAASAFVVIDESGNNIFSRGYYLGESTNNRAEYGAVLKALEWFISSGFKGKILVFYLDSLLVVSQLKGLFKIKDVNLRDYYLRVKNIIEVNGITILDYIHIPRALNTRADAVVNQILDNLE